MFNAVGIDVSKQKSTVAVLQPAGIIVRKPFDVPHTKEGLNGLVDYIQSLDGETKVVMECTGHYHEPVLKAIYDAGIYVSAVNPCLIKRFGNNTVRKVKSDPADAKKIARYTLDNWSELRHYSVMDETRKQLKALNMQFDFLMKQKCAAKCNLISLLDHTYPGVNTLFDSPVREDGSEKWVDFAYTFWHVDCVVGGSLNAFSKHYERFCRKHRYQFQQQKAEDIYKAAKELYAVYPKEMSYLDVIHMSIENLRSLSRQVETLRAKMNEVASTLPEYDVVLSMRGVGPTLGPQLMAEIGDIRRFKKREALTAYAGVDPGVNESGDFKAKSNRASKCGPPRLRKTLFQIMATLIQLMPTDDPVYRFIDKKRSEGKKYHVYMTAGANKFLRIYYGNVKEHLASLDDEK